MCAGPETMAALSALQSIAAPVGLAMQLMSWGEQGNAMADQQKAMADAQAAESMRQLALQDKRMAEIDQALPGFDAKGRSADIDSEAANVEKQIGPGDKTVTADEINAYGNFDAATPTEVKSDLANAMLTAINRAKTNAKSTARLSAHGGVAQRKAFDLSRTGERVGLINDASQGSLGVYGSELDAARLAGSDSQRNADLLGGLGTLGTLYGMSAARGGAKRVTGLTPLPGGQP